MTVVRVAPDNYAEVIKMTMKDLGNGLSVKALKKERVEHYRFLIARGVMKDEVTNGNGHETVLQATDFKGKCYKCGQTGHKANDPRCPMYKKKGKNKFKGLCHLCGAKGHKEKDCWEKEENASKRPTNWKSKLDRNNVATDSEELLLMASEKKELVFNPSIELLKDPNVFIYDTGATCHTTFSDIGMSNLKESVESTTITYGNGSSAKAEKKCDLSGVVCNKNGQEIKRVAMKNVKLVPNSKYNLFSVTQRVVDGWKIGGDKKKGLYLEKSDN